MLPMWERQVHTAAAVIASAESYKCEDFFNLFSNEIPKFFHNFSMM